MIYVVKVKNLVNDKVHFARVLDIPESVDFPFSMLERSLRFLFSNLNVMVIFEVSPQPPPM